MQFTKTEIRQFLPYLQLDLVVFRNCCTATPEVALCLVLWRLSYPSRYKDTQDLFGHSKAWQSTIFNDTILHLVNQFCLMLFWDHEHLTIDKLKEYATAVGTKCQTDRVWGFVDGTI